METAMNNDSERKVLPGDPVTTEEFVAMVIRSSTGHIEPTRGSWSSGYMNYALHKGITEDYDLTNISNPIERRSAARIVHEALVTEFGEQDEREWSAAEKLRDLYACRTCVVHIAQVYVKGIMLGREQDVFDGEGSLTRAEAAAIVARMLDKEQRIHLTGGRVLQSKHLTPDEAWMLMLHDHTAMIVDVRTHEDYAAGHLQGSICIPLQDVSNNPFSICTRKDTPLILYCQRGYKSSVAAQVLVDAGYSKVYTIPGIEQFPYTNLMR